MLSYLQHTILSVLLGHGENSLSCLRGSFKTCGVQRQILHVGNTDASVARFGGEEDVGQGSYSCAGITRASKTVINHCHPFRVRHIVNIL